MFVELEKLLTGIDLTITIRKGESELMVSVLPKNNNLKDQVKSLIPPIIITGTSTELDSEFLKILSKGLPKASKVFTNLQNFEKETERAEANSKMALAKKEAESKIKKEQKEKRDELLKKAKEAEINGKYEDAIKHYTSAKTFSDTPADLDKLITTIRFKFMQPTLF